MCDVVLDIAAVRIIMLPRGIFQNRIEYKCIGSLKNQS
jgi:hypothetical protein